MVKNNFTLNDYKELLSYFKKTHRFMTFSEYFNHPEEKKTILLRHDIDISLEKANEMATIESLNSVKATYFILFSSPFYNVFDKESIDILKNIKTLGHEIGLHYDVDLIQQVKGDTYSFLQAQAILLNEIIGDEVFSIAMHNPSISGDDIFTNTKFINAYDDIFIKDMAYYSDSCGAWRNNFIKCFQNNTFPQKIQLAIHPIHYRENELSRWDNLKETSTHKINDIKNQIGMIEEIWRNHSGVKEHEQRLLSIKKNN